MKHISEVVRPIMDRIASSRLGEKIIYLSILSFKDHPKRDVRVLTEAEKARHLTLEHLFMTTPITGRLIDPPTVVE